MSRNSLIFNNIEIYRTKNLIAELKKGDNLHICFISGEKIYSFEYLTYPDRPIGTLITWDSKEDALLNVKFLENTGWTILHSNIF